MSNDKDFDERAERFAGGAPRFVEHANPNPGKTDEDTDADEDAK